MSLSRLYNVFSIVSKKNASFEPPSRHFTAIYTHTIPNRSDVTVARLTCSLENPLTKIKRDDKSEHTLRMEAPPRGSQNLSLVV